VSSASRTTRDRRRAAGLCSECGVNPSPAGTTCGECRDVRALKERQRYHVNVALSRAVRRLRRAEAARARS